MVHIQDLKAKDVAKYVLLPGVIPRIMAFAESGFGWLAFMMAVVYNAVRLLPDGHPYLSPQNMGKYGIRHVIVEAANNLVIKKENIDQILIFFILLLGMLLLVLQCAALIAGFVVRPAAAAGLAAFVGLFETRTPETDIAYMLMDKVFGVPDLFGSNFSPAPGAVPPFNMALQELFQYYSYAMLVVGAVIFLYYVIVIVGETANTGTPFGRRFNHIYAPLRLVAAIGFLVPLAYGLNSAQYITLLAAKFGSSFATNSWIIFNQALASGDTLIGTHKEALIARPQAVDIKNIFAFMSVVNACDVAYADSFTPPNDKNIQAWLAKNDPAPENALLGTYQEALAFYENKDVTIYFGIEHEEDTEQNFVGNIEPLCGSIVIPTNVAGNEDGSQPADQRIGAYLVQQAFFDTIEGLWGDVDLQDFGSRASAMYIKVYTPCSVDVVGGGDCEQLPDQTFKNIATSFYQQDFNARLADAYNQMVALADTLYDVPQELLERGWGGAAIWYNHIAEWNGGLATATVNVPTASKMPDVMERIQEERRSHDQSVDTELRYQPVIVGGKSVSSMPNRDLNIAQDLSEVYRYWMTDGRGVSSDVQNSGNVFFDLLNSVFGIGGLFTIRNNDDIHPLAQLAALGKSILESSIRNLLTALVASAGGGMGEILGLHLGAALGSVSQLFVAFATSTLAIGFILYYVLPFLPFMYFFFAVGAWVKSVFEAMVGVPLWALAHLRIDGNGFPGDTAMNGYFLIFEIFVRPILTVFGLIAGMAVFGAMARTLNGVFDLVVENLSGFDCTGCDTAAVAGIEYKRNVIDEFFFTIIYTIIVYMLALSSFKMIDQVPNSILRWMGAGVQSFGDQHDDPAQGMVQMAAFGGAQMAGQIGGALNQGARTMGQAVGLPFGMLARNNKDVRAAGEQDGGNLRQGPPGLSGNAGNTSGSSNT